MTARNDTPPGWEGILDQGERIVWQGRPDGAVVFRPASIATFLFGLAFAGFAMFWMVMAAQGGGLFWMSGLIHFSVGLGISFGALFWGAFKRRHTWYTLTDRRAFIATNLPLKGKKLKSYPIAEDTVLRLEQSAIPSVWFGKEHRDTANGSRRVDVGFERIPDALAVYRQMRDIQKGAA